MSPKMRFVENATATCVVARSAKPQGASQSRRWPRRPASQTLLVLAPAPNFCRRNCELNLATKYFPDRNGCIE